MAIKNLIPTIIAISLITACGDGTPAAVDDPDIPIVPDTPVVPDIPVVPDVPMTPIAPGQPVVPDVPMTPLDPATPITPEFPVIIVNPQFDSMMAQYGFTYGETYEICSFAGCSGTKDDDFRITSTVESAPIDRHGLATLIKGVTWYWWPERRFISIELYNRYGSSEGVGVRNPTASGITVEYSGGDIRITNERYYKLVDGALQTGKRGFIFGSNVIDVALSIDEDNKLEMSTHVYKVLIEKDGVTYMLNEGVIGYSVVDGENLKTLKMIMGVIR